MSSLHPGTLVPVAEPGTFLSCLAVRTLWSVQTPGLENEPELQHGRIALTTRTYHAHPKAKSGGPFYHQEMTIDDDLVVRLAARCSKLFSPSIFQRTRLWAGFIQALLVVGERSDRASITMAPSSLPKRGEGRPVGHRPLWIIEKLFSADPLRWHSRPN